MDESAKGDTAQCVDDRDRSERSQFFEVLAMAQKNANEYRRWKRKAAALVFLKDNILPDRLPDGTVEAIVALMG